jgi:hypothetical protein
MKRCTSPPASRSGCTNPRLEKRQPTLGQKFDNAPARFVPAEDERRDVDRVLRREDLLFEALESLFAGNEELEGVSAYRGAGAGGVDGLGGGEDLAGRIERLQAFELGEKTRFAFEEAAEFSASKHQIQRYAHVGSQEDDEHPGHGITRLAFFGEETGDEEDGEQERRDRQ